MNDCNICEKDCNIHVPCETCKSTCEKNLNHEFNGKFYCCTSERDTAKEEYEKTLIKSETE